MWLEISVSVWRSLGHIGYLWIAFLATPQVHALINVGGRMYVPYPPFDVVSVHLETVPTKIKAPP